MFVLDTNVCVQFLRGKNLPIRQHLSSDSTHEVCLCSVVLSELYCGALRSAKPVKNRAGVDQTAADVFASIRHHLETRGTPIGPYDLQIAAIALANGCTLVTHNTGEFQRVPGLLLVDWETL